MENKELAITLARADREEEVIEVLKSEGAWGDSRSWEYYGGRENNFGEIGNQQSEPAAALVEKITNSVDAMLMAQVLSEGIDPEGENAPPNITTAQEEFFNIYSGNLANITAEERTTLAENIALVASGGKTSPSYSIIDKGEGQTPKQMPGTILSLGESNKLRIPFVQGKFNMGGTGALQFSGERNLQLVISKRHPEVAKYERDRTKDKWGFTLVRREDPKEGMKNSTFTYLAPDGEIPQFEAKSVPLWPGEHPQTYGKPLKWGTFLKLYDYDMTGMKSIITFDLYNHLSLLLPKTALPFRLFERRDYEGHSMESTLSGLSVRLEEDKRKNLVSGFPTFHKMNVLGQTLRTHVYAFREGAEENYKDHEGVLFTINGQTHGHFKDRFFGRNNVGMEYIKDSILVIVDCSELDGRIREDTFMNSRDRLRSTEFRSNVERELEKVLNNHPGLKELREKRQRKMAREETKDSKPLEQALNNILKASPTFSSLFIEGERLSNPFNLEESSTSEEEYEGEFFPTYFKMIKNYGEENPKEWHINERCRIQFTTDAENDYFGRDKEPGDFKLLLEGETYDNYSLNLWNGRATLNLTAPTRADVGDNFLFKVVVDDVHHTEPFTEEFYAKIEPEREMPPGGPGDRKTSSSGDEEDEEEPSQLALPDIYEVRKPNWDEHDFSRESALNPIYDGSSYDFYINMDNVHLLTEKKHIDDAKAPILDSRYKYGMALLGLSLLRDGDKNQKTENPEKYSTERVREIARQVSPVLLPMFNALAEL